MNMAIRLRVLLTVGIVLFLPAVFAAVPSVAYAEETSVTTTSPAVPTEVQIKAAAGEDRSVAVARKVLFDASKSSVPEGAQVHYSWNFGDGTTGEGIDPAHAYAKVGDFTVTLTAAVDDKTSKDTVAISVYEDLVLLVTDGTPKTAQIESLRKQAARQGVLLKTISTDASQAEALLEAQLVDALLAAVEDVDRTDLLVVWTKGALGLNVLSSFGSKTHDRSPLTFERKGVIVVTDQPLPTVSRVAQSAFDLLQPKYLLLTEEGALSDVVSARSPEEAVDSVRGSDVPSRLIGAFSERGSELTWNNFMSYAVNYMINRGVPAENIILLLLLPVIATLVAIARQVIGVKTFGIYTPSIIALAFVVTGLKFGLTVFLLILVVATVMRYALRSLKLSYLPRMALVLTAVAAAIFFVLLGGAANERTGITAVSIFPFLVLTMLVEKFVTAQAEKGLRAAIMLSAETILTAVAAYFLVTWPTFRTFLLAYPEVLLLTPLINVLAGRWTGLRVFEYFRFRAVRGSEESGS